MYGKNAITKSRDGGVITFAFPHISFISSRGICRGFRYVFLVGLKVRDIHFTSSWDSLTLAIKELIQ